MGQKTEATERGHRGGPVRGEELQGCVVETYRRVGGQPATCGAPHRRGCRPFIQLLPVSSPQLQLWLWLWLWLWLDSELRPRRVLVQLVHLDGAHTLGTAIDPDSAACDLPSHRAQLQGGPRAETCIFWNSMSEGPTGYTAYSHTGWGAVQGERQKRDSWRQSIDRRRDMSAGDVEFVPFSIEAGGVWGPAAKKFFRECLALADDDRDIDLYHWSSSKFSAAWLDTLSVLVARGRAQVGVAAATTDWPKRIREMRYADQNDRGTAD